MNKEHAASIAFCGHIEDGKHLLTVRVYYADTDFSGVVYHGRYLEFFERGRSEFLRLHDFHHHLLLEAEEGAACAWIVRRMSLDFIHPAHIDDILRVGTEIAQIKPARILMTQQIWREERLLVKAQVEVALINAAGRARRLPVGIIEAFS